MVFDVIIGCLCVFVAAFVIAMAYIYLRRNGDVKLRFKQFRKLYIVNPEAWELCDDKALAIRLNGSTTTVYFRGLDVFRYWCFVQEQKKMEKNREACEKMQKLLDDCRKDIEKSRQKAEEKIAKAKAEMQNPMRSVKTAPFSMKGCYGSYTPLKRRFRGRDVILWVDATGDVDNVTNRRKERDDEAAEYCACKSFVEIDMDPNIELGWSEEPWESL